MTSWARSIALVLIAAVFPAAALSSPEGGGGTSLPEAFLPESCRAAARRLSITEGIALVLKDSRLIKISLPDRDMAFEDTYIARSAFFPHVSASLAETFYRYQPGARFSGGTAVSTAERQSFSYGADLYQTIYDFGRSLSQYRASREALKASEANVESVRRMAVLEFVSSYFDLLQAEKMIEVAEKEVESLKAYAADVERLYAQGVVVKNDLLPAQVRLADAKQRLIASRNSRRIAVASLDTMLSLPLDESLSVRDIRMQPPELPDISEAWKIAESQRPEITFLENGIRASGFAEKVRERENLPTVFVQGGYSHAQNKYQLHEDNAEVRLGAKMNLYEGGADRAELRKERSRKAKLMEQKRKLVEDIRFEVENSYVVLRNAGEKVLVARDALAQADENVRFARARYAEGAGTATEVLEAIALQTASRTNYFGADYELKRGYARLMYSLGIDLSLVYERMERDNHGDQG